MIRVRSVSMWGIVLGWAATRCCVPALADEPPKPPTNGTAGSSAEAAVPAPAPPADSALESAQPVPMAVPVQPVRQTLTPVAEPVTTVTAVTPAQQLPPGVTAAVPAPKDASGKVFSLEVVKERYPNKQVAVERHVTRDEKNNYVNHGSWTMYDPDGHVMCQGEFLNGKAIGKWTRTFREGGEDPYTGAEYDDFVRPFKAEATFVEDKLVGTWTLVDSRGNTIHSWEFNEDRLNGKAIAYHSNGQIRTEAAFVNGVLDGEALEYDARGNKLSSTAWTAGRRIGPTTQRYPSGAKYSEGEYYYAREDKAVQYDFFKGTIVSDKMNSKAANSRHGHWVWWYEDGEKMCEGDFVDGKPVGHHIWYHPNGQKEMEGDFVEGKRHGMWLTWFPNGQKKSEGLYDGGREAGQWFAWNETGKVVSAVQYQQPRGMDPNSQHPAAIANGPAQNRVYSQNQRPVNGRRPQTVSDLIQRQLR